ncbi:MAG: FAD-dependent protein [Elusimicrobiota bacterium]
MKNNEKPVIIGFGPAGMFAALELVERGIKPLIFERGRKLEERSVDIQRFIKEKVLNEESNIQFGEGGAGSYSDGKLFSKPGRNSAEAQKALDTFIRFGAPENIRSIGKPHLGTDVLCKIVANIRDHILEKGGEIHYSSKMTDIIILEKNAAGVVINGNKEYRSSCIYLAIGHSARDTFGVLNEKGVIMEQKPISVGIRIEHPVEIANRFRYGEASGGKADNYSFTHNKLKTGRGVATFCMCPGGEIVNASSENGLLALNGMSYSGRTSAFSNSAIVVACKTDDFGSADPLAGIEFQREIERKAFNAGGGNWKVPAQNLTDFLSGRISANLNENSCKTGTASASMNLIFPNFVCVSLREAFNAWKLEYPLFVSEHGILLGAETRTTCPLRIRRGENYEAENLGNLYPIGEGSGYAGGIMSSAIDAIKAVERIMN